ncbi:MAG TPA: LLM class flavin-dependent oxidoreductase [Candidatus Binataceae bacterium]|nr:LLM class flavin-dependent oxidoreductase [Candidatus Binataceae bacterium]
MDVGLFSELQCPPGKPVPEAYREIVEEAELADQLGFRSLWLAELHFTRDFSVMPAPQLVAAAIAARTRRLRLGIGVYILPTHHPLRLAEEAATLDILSNGRFDFGAGRGHPFTRVYEGFAVPSDESRQRFDECLEIVKRAWTEPSVTYKGKFFSFDDLEVVPKPLQKPYPPIYVGAVSPGSFLSAGEHGYNVMVPAQVTPLPLIKELLASYRDRLPNPSSPPRASLLLPMFVAKNRKDAESLPRESIMSYYEISGRLMAQLAQRKGLPEQFKAYDQVGGFMKDLTYERVLSDYAVFGEPAEVCDRLLQLREELELDEILAWINIGGLSHELVSASMRLMAEQVLPHLSR